MKRPLIVFALVVFFILLIALIPGCSAVGDLSSSVQGASVFNPIEAGKPGSGSWVPRTPSNARQCRALNTAETDLIEKTMNLADAHHNMIRFCYDKAGNRIVNSENELCQEPIQKLEGVIEKHTLDVFTGYDTYNASCQSMGTPPINLPGDLGDMRADEEPGEKEGGGDDDPKPTSEPHYWGCLTCTHNLELDYFAFNSELIPNE